MKQLIETVENLRVRGIGFRSLTKALAKRGCEKILTEQVSGAVADRPALHDALEFARSGDTLIVWKLDRLARSLHPRCANRKSPRHLLHLMRRAGPATS